MECTRNSSARYFSPAVKTAVRVIIAPPAACEVARVRTWLWKYENHIKKNLNPSDSFFNVKHPDTKTSCACRENHKEFARDILSFLSHRYQRNNTSHEMFYFEVQMCTFVAEKR
jgi:hypothetical protein